MDLHGHHGEKYDVTTGGKMRRPLSLVALIAFVSLVSPIAAQNPPATAPPQQAAGDPPQTGTGQAGRRAPRPYEQVITARAVTERGALIVHKVDDRYFFEV